MNIGAFFSRHPFRVLTRHGNFSGCLVSSFSTKRRAPHGHKAIETQTSAPEDRTRLNKWLAHQGLCSRREADDWIARGHVTLNGHVVTSSPAFVAPTDDVQVDDKILATQKPTIILHKPLGIVSSQPENGHAPAIQLLTAERQFRNQTHQQEKRQGHNNPFRQRGWKVAGRLDINSTGLLVLTQSGLVAQQIVSPRPGLAPLEKEYLVRIPSDNLDDLAERLHVLRQGVHDQGDFLQATSIEALHHDQLRIVLTAGKHHHIRRMLQSVQLPVRALKRVRIGQIVLRDLPVGQWRYLGTNESF